MAASSLPPVQWMLTHEIVGVFYNDQIAASQILADDPVTFMRDPANEYDGNAILALDRHGRKLGHLAAPLVKHLSPLLDEGLVQLEAKAAGQVSAMPQRIPVCVVVSEQKGCVARVHEALELGVCEARKSRGCCTPYLDVISGSTAAVKGDAADPEEAPTPPGVDVRQAVGTPVQVKEEKEEEEEEEAPAAQAKRRRYGTRAVATQQLKEEVGENLG